MNNHINGNRSGFIPLDLSITKTRTESAHVILYNVIRLMTGCRNTAIPCSRNQVNLSQAEPDNTYNHERSARNRPNMKTTDGLCIEQANSLSDYTKTVTPDTDNGTSLSVWLGSQISENNSTMLVVDPTLTRQQSVIRGSSNALKAIETYRSKNKAEKKSDNENPMNNREVHVSFRAAVCTRPLRPVMPVSETESSDKFYQIHKDIISYISQRWDDPTHDKLALLITDFERENPEFIAKYIYLCRYFKVNYDKTHSSIHSIKASYQSFSEKNQNDLFKQNEKIISYLSSKWVDGTTYELAQLIANFQNKKNDPATNLRFLSRYFKVNPATLASYISRIRRGRLVYTTKEYNKTLERHKVFINTISPRWNGGTIRKLAKIILEYRQTHPQLIPPYRFLCLYFRIKYQSLTQAIHYQLKDKIKTVPLSGIAF